MPKNDALARRSPNGDGGHRQLYLGEFTQEEIAEKVGMDRSVVRRDLKSARDICRSGDSPDLEVAHLYSGGYPDTGTGTLHVV